MAALPRHHRGVYSQNMTTQQIGSRLMKFIWRYYGLILLVLSIIFLSLGTIANESSYQSSSVHLPGKKRLFQASEVDSNPLNLCPVLPEDLGLVGEVPVNITAPSWAELESMFPDLDPGGRWRPRDCIARSRVAVVVPYRNRDYNLRAFLQHMHTFLRKQKLDYGIIVSEQSGNGTFNRGITRNIGFMEGNRFGEYDCSIFNDVDLLPQNDMNSYGCPDLPRHMCIALDYFQYRPVASGAVFGGIVAFRNDHFREVNGYSNLYFGWGGEDDDILTRCKKTGVGFYRARPQYGRYKGTPHTKDHRTRSTYKLWRYRTGRADVDGLNSLNYTVLDRQRKHLYTWILADVNQDKYQQQADVYLHSMDLLHRNDTKPPRLPNVKVKTARQPKDTNSTGTQRTKWRERKERQMHGDINNKDNKKGSDDVQS